MSIVLRSEVGVIEGFFGFRKLAVMDLHDDGRFVLVRIDPKTQEFGEMIFDNPVDDLSVGGAGTYLTLRGDGKKKRVDFAVRSAIGTVGFGIIGYAVSAAFATAAGRPEWIAVFKARGLVRGLSNTGRNLVVLGIIAGALILVPLLVVIVATALNP